MSEVEKILQEIVVVHQERLELWERMAIAGDSARDDCLIIKANLLQARLELERYREAHPKSTVDIAKITEEWEDRFGGECKKDEAKLSAEV